MVIVDQSGEHNYDRAVVLDYHFPEVLRGVWKWTLSRDKPRNIFRSLQAEKSVLDGEILFVRVCSKIA